MSGVLLSARDDWDVSDVSSRLALAVMVPRPDRNPNVGSRPKSVVHLKTQFPGKKRMGSDARYVDYKPVNQMTSQITRKI